MRLPTLATVSLIGSCALGAAVAQPREAKLPQVSVSAPREAEDSSVLAPLATPLRDAPLSSTVIGPEVLHTPGTRSISSAIGRDASIGENYAIDGYYENFSLRGFLLDLGSSYRVNGLVVPGEMHIALDDKERIEVLKGMGNLSGGNVAAGGIVNFVTKRPASVRAATLEASQHGGWRAGVDIGASTWRLNAVHEEMRPGPVRANGHRDLVALAGDARFGDLSLAADFEYGRRSQPAVPGFQLLGGTVVPQGIDPLTNINQQPWSRPVRNESRLAQVRARYVVGDSMLSVGVSDAAARIDDSLAFPFGCNDAPYQYFCADGGYVLYDYRAFERRGTRHWNAAWSGLATTGELRHDFSVGVERIVRTVQQRQLYSSTIYDTSGLAMSGNVYTPQAPLPQPPALGVDLPDRRVTQPALFAADQVTFGAWRANLGLRLAKVDQQPVSTAKPGWYALPQFALTWHASPSERIYFNSARGLELGSEAPAFAENAGQLLAPRQVTQTEIGWRREGRAGETMSVALFRWSRPYEFTDPVGASWAGLGNFRQAGRQVHTGVELGGSVPVARTFVLSGNAAWLEAIARGTGVAAYEDRQVQNVPRLRFNGFASYKPFANLELGLRWLHVGQRNARRDGLATVPGFDRFDASANWALSPTTRLQLAIENLANKRYWRDVGEAYSADLLFPGRPRSVSAALVFDAQ